MPFVPLPFVVALLLLILFAALARRDDETPENRPFLALIAACAVQSVLLGLRWGYGIDAVRFVPPVLAAAIAPLVYLSFAGLVQRDSRPDWAGPWLHALPAGAMIILAALWREPIDLVLIATYLGYAAALLRVAASGPDALRLTRLDGAIPSYRALQAAAAALALSAAVDVLVVLDFEWTQGAHAATVVAIANLLGLFVLGFAAVVAGRNQPSAEPVGPLGVATSALDEDSDIMAKIDDLMQKQKLFRDANLSLDRLARKAGIPARRISTAINRIAQKNVSQYVNDLRIAEARRLLAETGEPVTTIMFEAGFQTKSNFNREFRRVTGTNPTHWREKTANGRA